MKTVSSQKHRYTYKDWLRWILTALAHYAAFALLIVVVLSIRYIYNDDFIPRHPALVFLIYPVFVGPLVNIILHIFYVEKGNTNVKALLWFHTLGIVLWIIIGGFLI